MARIVFPKTAYLREYDGVFFYEDSLEDVEFDGQKIGVYELREVVKVSAKVEVVTTRVE